MARQQARLNVGRLNAFRLGDYYPSVWIYINSLLISRPGAAQGIVVDKSLTVQEAEGDVPTTWSFKVRASTSLPQQGQSCYVALGSNDHRILGGAVISCTQEADRYGDKTHLTVRCESNHRLLNRRLITAQFLSTDAGVIIRTLATSWTSGFTTNHVKGTLGQIDFIEFTRERPARAMQRVIDRIGGRWYLDQYNDIHAYTGDEAGVSLPAALTATGKQWNWQHERDISQVRTRVYVRGADAPIIGDSDGGVVDIGKNGVGVSTGIANFAEAQTIGMGRAFYQVTSVTVNSVNGYGELTFTPATAEELPAGTMVAVYGIAQSTTYQNSLAAIEGGDGVHEYSMTDGRMTHAGALQRAQAEIGIFGPIEHKGTYDTRDPSASIGRLIAVNVASPTHISSVSAKIQRVTVSHFEDSTRSWSANDTHLFPRRAVTYSSAAVRDVAQILGDFERDGS